MARSSGAEPIPVEVRRSARRRRTVSAYREADRVVVLLPDRFSQAEEQEWVRRMLDRLAARERRRRPGNAQLLERGRYLARRYFPDHLAEANPASVRWVSNQNGRWGSCTPRDRTIRLSTRLRGMPEWVIDYVLLHEIAHLVTADHGPDFWALMSRYPRTERARGFLEGVAAAAGLDMADDRDSDTGDDGADNDADPEAADSGAPAADPSTAPEAFDTVDVVDLTDTKTADSRGARRDPAGNRSTSPTES